MTGAAAWPARRAPTAAGPTRSTAAATRCSSTRSTPPAAPPSASTCRSSTRSELYRLGLNVDPASGAITVLERGRPSATVDPRSFEVSAVTQRRWRFSADRWGRGSRLARLRWPSRPGLGCSRRPVRWPCGVTAAPPLDRGRRRRDCLAGRRAPRRTARAGRGVRATDFANHDRDDRPHRRGAADLARAHDGLPTSWDSRPGDPLVLVFGCIHGDECAGIRAARLAATCRLPAPRRRPRRRRRTSTPTAARSGTRLNARRRRPQPQLRARLAADRRAGRPEYSGSRPFSEPETRIARG